jgi:SNF family Na+-dependent transporter
LCKFSQSPKGAGLAFIAFTEAMTKMEGSWIWSVLFFVMLINLGLGSMFGTLAGIITPLTNLGLNLRKEVMVGK